ncbi:MAG TPA: DUF5615 family PIN-like protein [Thermoanaerobaculia bacterium]|nr:DUF5615 family PIN-like protein [Thermoanaerobaculia bacterium]
MLSLEFLVDEDLPRSLARDLRAAGFVARDVRDLGMRGAPDELVWAKAQSQGWALISGDLGFANLMTYPLGSHSGIIVGRFANEVPAVAVVRRIVVAVQALDPEEICGSLVIVEPERIRLRKA